jgi:hypothetical protein
METSQIGRLQSLLDLATFGQSVIENVSDLCEVGVSGNEAFLLQDWVDDVKIGAEYSGRIILPKRFLRDPQNPVEFMNAMHFR